MSSNVDVVIVGGGPVGCLIAAQLARFGIKPYVLEQDDKTVMPCYGRACTLWPRSIELLDQVDMAEPLIQLGVATRNALHFHEGKRVPGGLMYASRMDKLGDTSFKFALHLRQRIIEQQFTQIMEDLGVDLHMQQQLIDIQLLVDAEAVHPVKTMVKDLKSGEIFTIKSKYIIGADGGKSTVRKLAGIGFPGESTTHRWIRMDALVETDMPNPRCLNSIDSASHGQILWCPIDGGMTRIGYVFSQALIDKYGGVEGITQEVVVREAKEALAPFRVDFLRVDWFTIYGIGQRIADTFLHEERVILAGDACHTHSSGSAQGLNTGIHDAVNLAWKLALVLKGAARPGLLETYNTERRHVVQQIIDNDRTISTLISGHYPPKFAGRAEPPREILKEWFSDMNMQSFTLGLGVSYPANLINKVSVGSSKATVDVGERAPDVFVSTLGTADPIRLHQILKNTGAFSILVFAGAPRVSRPYLAKLCDALNASDIWISRLPRRAVRWIILCADSGNAAHEVLGMPPMGGGRVYLDTTRAAHEVYGVDVERGALVVMRPDGWVGTIAGVDEIEALEAYFRGIFAFE